MTKQDTIAREQFTTRLADEFAPDTLEWERRKTIKREAALLLRHCASYHRNAVDECNGPADSWPGEPIDRYQARIAHWEKRCEQQMARLERLITATCARIDPRLVPVFGGDPRGAVVMLTGLPSGYTDNWEWTGLSVPHARY